MDNVSPGNVYETPNANTPTSADQDTPPLSGVVNKLDRLADKLFGAVEFNVSNALDGSMRTDDVALPVSSPSLLRYLPNSAQSFISRNLTALSIMFLGMLAFFFIKVIRR